MNKKSFLIASFVVLATIILTQKSVSRNNNNVLYANIEALSSEEYYLNPNSKYKSGIADGYSAQISPLTPKSGTETKCKQLWRCVYTGECCGGNGWTIYEETWTELL